MVSVPRVAKGYFAPVCNARLLSVRFYNWDVSRYVGDSLHLLALLLCLGAILRENGTAGVSFKTHLLFLLVYTARFTNTFLCSQPMYLVIYKVVLWSLTLHIVLLMLVRGSVRDQKDTVPLLFLTAPTLIVTLVIGQYALSDSGLFSEVLYIFSTYLETVAMLPQYVYCYRDSDNPSPLVLLYVLAMGGNRLVFGLSWGCHYVLGNGYVDITSLLSGTLGILFFADYLVLKMRSKSMLSSLVISLDEGIREASEAAFAAADGSASLLPVSEHLEPHDELPPDEIGKSMEEIELASLTTDQAEVTLAD